ncbi:MAG: BTAD domain-containing putative transcriptional regulator [Gemmatimonadota bacterium]|jgi:DNA-binding SARP family transcriptional activator
MFVLKTLGTLSLATSTGEVLASESKPLLVLAVLALSPGEEAKRDHLANLLWPSSDRTRARSSLRQALHQLRNAGVEQVIDTDEATCRLRNAFLEVDVWTFHRAVEERRFRDAVSVYGGPFLGTVRDKMGSELRHWADAEEARIQIALEEASSVAIRAAIARGAVADAEAMARRFVARDPLREAPTLLLIEALVAQDRELEALQEAESYRTLLATELGDEPGGAFEETVEALTRSVHSPPDTGADPPGGRMDPAMAARGDGRRESQDGESRPRWAGPRGRFRWTAAAVVLVGAVAVAAWAARPGARRATDDPSPVFTVTARTEEGALGDLTVTPAGVTFTPWTHAEPTVVPSPSGARLAYTARTPSGTDLMVRERGGAARPVLMSHADENPLGWSPDGEWLLYTRGWYEEASNRYRIVLGKWEARTDARREFPLEGFDGKAVAAWSPDGTAIAVGGGDSLLVMDPAGRVTHRVGAGGGFVGSVAWSPDSRRVATTVHSEGPADVYVLSRDEGILRRVVATAGHETDVVWVGDEHLVALSAVGTRSQLLLVDVRTARARVLADDVEIAGLFPALDVGRPVRIGSSEIGRLFAGGPDRAGVGMVDSIALEGPETPVSVGEHLFFHAVPLSSEGEILSRSHLEIRWWVDGDQATKVDEGVFVVESEGFFEVRAEVPGWRAAGRRLRAVEPVRSAPAAPLLEETWTGDAAGRWRFVGDPRPMLVPGEGPDGGGALRLGGDQNFSTAVISEEVFSLERGLTVEVWSRTSRLEENFQEWHLELVPADHVPDTVAEPRAFDPTARVSLNGVESRIFASGLSLAYRMPLPEGLDRWRRYTIQLSPDGRMLFLVDGRVYFRTSLDDPVAEGPVRILLGDQSVNSRMLYGPLRVFEGPVYE